MKAPAVAKMFGVTTHTVRNWIKTGTLTSIKINNRWYVRRIEVVALARQRHG